MKCILCFFEPIKQKELMRISHMLEQTFEKTLERYLEFFINSFCESLDENICSEHGTENNSEILEELRKSKNEIIELIINDTNLLKEIYMDYVNGKTQKSIEKFEKLYDEIFMEDTAILQEYLFFRGRRSKEQLTEKELYHIPFNKRHFISNQRYSLSGRPLLYLGYNVHTVIKELSSEISLEDVKDIYLTTFSLRDNIKIKALNFTTAGFYNFLNTYLYPDDLIEVELNLSDLKNLIRKLNIINCCSFQRRYQNYEKFSEEYVLPQLLAIVVNKKENIDAIIYSSTKDFGIEEKIFTNQENKLDIKYKNNIAFFTTMNKEDDIYDEVLFNKFDILSPISIAKLSQKMIIKNPKFESNLAVERAEKMQFKDLEENYKYINTVEENLFFITNCMKSGGKK